MASASWYTFMTQNYAGTPSPFPDANGSHENIMEFAFELGATLTSTTASKIALFTMPDTGFLSSTKIEFQLTAALQDVDPNDPTRVHNVSVHNFVVSMPMSDLTVITNTCPSPSSFSSCSSGGGETLTLYTYIDISDHLQVDTPSPTRPGTTRRVSAKGVRGVQIITNGVSGTPIVVDGETYTCRSEIMQLMPTSTNCFPGQLHGCGVLAGSATPAYTHAAGSEDSVSCQCQSGPFPNTKCVKMYINSAPLRKLLYVNVVPSMTYTAGAWVVNTGSAASQVLYFTHGQTIGMQVPNTASCFPYASCGAADGTTTPLPAWLYVMGVVIVLYVLGGGLIAYLRYRQRAAWLSGVQSNHRTYPLIGS